MRLSSSIPIAVNTDSISKNESIDTITESPDKFNTEVGGLFTSCRVDWGNYVYRYNNPDGDLTYALITAAVGVRPYTDFMGPYYLRDYGSDSDITPLLKTSLFYKMIQIINKFSNGKLRILHLPNARMRRLSFETSYNIFLLNVFKSRAGSPRPLRDMLSIVRSITKLAGMLLYRYNNKVRKYGQVDKIAYDNAYAYDERLSLYVNEKALNLFMDEIFAWIIWDHALDYIKYFRALAWAAFSKAVPYYSNMRVPSLSLHYAESLFKEIAKFAEGFSTTESMTNALMYISGAYRLALKFSNTLSENTIYYGKSFAPDITLKNMREVNYVIETIKFIFGKDALDWGPKTKIILDLIEYMYKTLRGEVE